MTCDISAVIKRFRGDDDPHILYLTMKPAGSDASEPLDLDLISSAEFSFQKDVDTVVTYSCAKNADSLTGAIEVPFHVDDVDVAGTFEYDVQVIWAANGKKKTLVKSELVLEDDINKN